MKIVDFISGGKINSTNFKTFVKPFASMVIIFVLFIVLLNTGISKIKLQINEHKNSKQAEEILSIKLSKLSDENSLALENTNKLIVALPQRNSVMVMISQIKRLAVEKNITVGKLEISGLRAENNLNSIGLQIEIDAQDINSLMDFLKELPKVAPLSSVFGVKISNQENNKFVSVVELSVYWSDFPSTIPAVREPITSLSESELRILEAISKLREPEYQILEPSILPDRVEPFN